MAATFDGVNLVITLPSHGGAGSLGIDSQIDLYSDWKEWLIADSQRQGFPPAFRTTGGDALTTGIDAGAYYFIRNDLGWRIRPAEEDSTIYLTGNLAPQVDTLPILIPTIGNFTVLVDGLQPITQNVDSILDSIKIVIFGGKVVVDPGSTETGDDELGTLKNPCSNWATASIVALTEGLNDFLILNSITLDSNANISKARYQGRTGHNTVLTVSSAASVANTTFENCEVTGTLDGTNKIVNSTMNNITGFDGDANFCTLTGTITLRSGETANFYNCFSQVLGVLTPIIDINGSAGLAMRDYTGGIKIINCTSAVSHSIDMSSGQIILDSTTVTNGTFVVRGIGKLVDQFGTSIETGTWNGGVTIVNELLTAGAVGGGGGTWSELEKDDIIAAVDSIVNKLPLDGGDIASGSDVLNIIGAGLSAGQIAQLQAIFDVLPVSGLISSDANVSALIGQGLTPTEASNLVAIFNKLPLGTIADATDVSALIGQGLTVGQIAQLQAIFDVLPATGIIASGANVDALIGQGLDITESAQLLSIFNKLPLVGQIASEFDADGEGLTPTESAQLQAIFDKLPSGIEIIASADDVGLIDSPWTTVEKDDIITNVETTKRQALKAANNTEAPN